MFLKCICMYAKNGAFTMHAVSSFRIYVVVWVSFWASSGIGGSIAFRRKLSACAHSRWRTRLYIFHLRNFRAFGATSCATKKLSAFMRAMKMNSSHKRATGGRGAGRECAIFVVTRHDAFAKNEFRIYRRMVRFYPTVSYTTKESVCKVLR